MKEKYIQALCDIIRFAENHGLAFSRGQIELLAEFCAMNNKSFDRAKWYAYIRDGPPK